MKLSKIGPWIVAFIVALLLLRYYSRPVQTEVITTPEGFGYTGGAVPPINLPANSPTLQFIYSGGVPTRPDIAMTFNIGSPYNAQYIPLFGLIPEVA